MAEGSLVTVPPAGAAGKNGARASEWVVTSLTGVAVSGVGREKMGEEIASRRMGVVNMVAVGGDGCRFVDPFCKWPLDNIGHSGSYHLFYIHMVDPVFDTWTLL